MQTSGARYASPFNASAITKTSPLATKRPLCDGLGIPDFLEELSKRRLRRKTHGSIRVQEGQPRIPRVRRLRR